MLSGTLGNYFLDEKLQFFVYKCSDYRILFLGFVLQLVTCGYISVRISEMYFFSPFHFF